MKKIIYTLLVAFSSTLLLTACTEEEVKPLTESSHSGYDFGDAVKK